MSSAMKKITTLIACISAAGMIGLSHAADPIQIAVVGPITGPVAQYGDMKMAVAQINAACGVNVRKLEAVLMDYV